MSNKKLFEDKTYRYSDLALEIQREMHEVIKPIWDKHIRGWPERHKARVSAETGCSTIRTAPGTG